MDFQDRFRDRSSLLTKNGLLTILNVPSNPVPKSTARHISPFYISRKNKQLLSSDLQHKRSPSVALSQHNSNNSGISLSSRASYSRQSPSAVQSNRVSPQNVFLLTRRGGMVRTPSTRESSRGTQTRRNLQD